MLSNPIPSVRRQCIEAVTYRIAAMTYLVFEVGLFLLAKPVSAQTTKTAVISYDRYRSPSACVAATHREEMLHWRSNRPDSIGLTTLASWSAPALAAARTCARRFNPDSVPSYELLPMMELMLIIGDDATARGVADRYVRGGEIPQRGLALVKVIERLLAARPLRLKEAERYATQLDGLGNRVAGLRVVAYTAISSWMAVLYDIPGIARTAQRGLDAIETLPDSSRLQWAEQFTQLKYRMSWVALEGPGGSTEAQSVLAKAADVLRPSRPDLANGLAGTIKLYAMEGLPAERVSGMWANIEPGDTIRPTPGSVSLIVFTSHLCGYFCYPALGSFRRLVKDQFNSDSSAVTMVQTGHGMFRLQGFPMTLEQELNKVKEQYVTDEKINVGIVMQEGPLSQLADGRYRTGATGNAQRYDLADRSAGAPIGVLVDRDGNIRMVESISPDYEERWKSVLKRMQ